MSETTTDPTEAAINPDEWRTITPADLAACEGRRLEVLTAAAVGENLRFEQGEWIMRTPHKYGELVEAMPRYLDYMADFWNLQREAAARFGDYDYTVQRRMDKANPQTIGATYTVRGFTMSGNTEGEALCRAYIAAAQKEAAHDA